MSRHSDATDFIAIARIIKPHGVRGAVRVEILSDIPDRLNTVDCVYI